MARRTLQNYLDLMSHGLGKTPDSRHSLFYDLNDAGRALFTLAEGDPFNHSWSWITRDHVNFMLPGNLVEQVVLPDDFSSLVSLQFDRTFVGRVIPTTLGELNRMRRTANFGTFLIYICFDVGEQQLNGSQPPRKVASFWPPQAVGRTNLQLIYRRTWVDMTSTDVNRIPDFPQEWDRLFAMLCRAYAIQLEDQTNPFEDQLVQTELARLVNYDAGKQPNKGRPTHSVRARALGSSSNQFYGHLIPRNRTGLSGGGPF